MGYAGLPQEDLAATLVRYLPVGYLDPEGRKVRLTAHSQLARLEPLTQGFPRTKRTIIVGPYTSAYYDPCMVDGP